MKLKKYIKKIGFLVKKAFQKKSNHSDITHEISGLKINLPSNHLLPVYQSSHPFYDKFLTILAQFLPKGSWVIDVGANCGDSLAAMVSSNKKINFLCIEADDVFYSYLLKNSQLILEKNQYPFICTVQALVGTSNQSVALVGEGGTKRASSPIGLPKQKLYKYKSLDVIFDEYVKDKRSTVSLIKVDTDGFDYDVINSGLKVIQRDQPLVFFECFIDNQDSLKKYKDLIQNLHSLKYEKWAVFDNYGRLLSRFLGSEWCHDILDYLTKQGNQYGSVSIYYWDILCWTNDHELNVEAALSKYLSL